MGWVMAQTDNVAVVVPLYRETLDAFEAISLRQCTKVLGHYRMIGLVPDTLTDVTFVKEFGFQEFIAIDASHLSSIGHYDALLKSPFFYRLFRRYEYMLIYQTDAFVFADRLSEFCGSGYDYIGAPWLDGEPIQYINFRGSVALNRLFPFINRVRKYYVGNGGLSLRNVAACERLVNDAGRIGRLFSLHEDGFFALHGSLQSASFTIAPFEAALRFAFDKDFSRSLVLNGNELPFGCHGWYRYEPDKVLPYVRACGYDL